MSDRAHPDVLGDTASNLGLEASTVASVLDEFMLQLHRGLVEYEGFNGDYIGENLSHRMPKQAFFHLLGFLDRFSERYEWEPGTAHEYLARLGPRADWQPFSHQLGGWVESSRYGRRTTTPQKGSEGL
jgi:hypothetical protein